MKDAIPCPKCGKPVKNQGVHNRYCSKNIIVTSAGTLPNPPSTQKVLKEEQIKSTSGTPDNSQSWWQKHFGSKPKPKPIEVSDPMELIEGLEPFEIPDKNPKSGVIGKIINVGKDFIQVVLVSELLEPKMFWAEKKGINRITYKDRMFILPRDIRGNVFFWHVDKKECLVDTANANNEDAESSLHESQVANIYYTLGRVASQNEMWSNVKFILLICLFIVLLSIGNIIYGSMIQKDVNNDARAIMDMISSMNNTIPR